MRDGYHLDGLHSVAELGDAPRSDIGPVANYLADVYELRPEVVRTEHLEFRIQFTAGVETFRTGAQRIDPEFIFALRRIKGYASTANVVLGQGQVGLPVQWVEQAVFNVRDQGRARGGIFANPIRMSVLCDIQGSPAHDMVWDSFYTFVAGADISVDWTVVAANVPQVGVVEYGISITGDVLRTRRLPGGAMVISNPSGERQG